VVLGSVGFFENVLKMGWIVFMFHNQTKLGAKFWVWLAYFKKPKVPPVQVWITQLWGHVWIIWFYINF
jgi:hypothetical protein